MLLLFINFRDFYRSELYFVAILSVCRVVHHILSHFVLTHYLGLFLFTAGSTMNFISFGYAAQSLLAVR